MKNSFKTILLFASLISLLGFAGYFLGGLGGFAVMLMIGVGINLFFYFFSGPIALRMAGAVELSRESGLQIHEMVETLSQKMQIPKPKIHIAPSLQANAFAAGRDKKSAVVCLNQGLINSLTPDEIEGVVAHELAHIKNNDILIATIAAVIAGVIGSLADLFLFSSLFGGNDEDGGQNTITGLLFLLLAPVIALIIQMSISRTREYAADATAAKFTGNPQGLASALAKISQQAQIMPQHVNPGMASLYILPPMALTGIAELFSTHPNVNKRIERLIGAGRIT